MNGKALYGNGKTMTNETCALSTSIARNVKKAPLKNKKTRAEAPVATPPRHMALGWLGFIRFQFLLLVSKPGTKVWELQNGLRGTSPPSKHPPKQTPTKLTVH